MRFWAQVFFPACGFAILQGFGIFHMQLTGMGNKDCTIHFLNMFAKDSLISSYWWEQVTWCHLTAREAGKCSALLGSHVQGQLYTMVRKAWTLEDISNLCYIPLSLMKKLRPKGAAWLIQGNTPNKHQNSKLNQIFPLPVSLHLLFRRSLLLPFTEMYVSHHLEVGLHQA